MEIQRGPSANHDFSPTLNFTSPGPIKILMILINNISVLFQKYKHEHLLPANSKHFIQENSCILGNVCFKKKTSTPSLTGLA